MLGFGAVALRWCWVWFFGFSSWGSWWVACAEILGLIIGVIVNFVFGIGVLSISLMSCGSGDEGSDFLSRILSRLRGFRYDGADSFSYFGCRSLVGVYLAGLVSWQVAGLLIVHGGFGVSGVDCLGGRLSSLEMFLCMFKEESKVSVMGFMISERWWMRLFGGEGYFCFVCATMLMAILFGDHSVRQSGLGFCQGHDLLLVVTVMRSQLSTGSIRQVFRCMVSRIVFSLLSFLLFIMVGVFGSFQGDDARESDFLSISGFDSLTKDRCRVWQVFDPGIYLGVLVDVISKLLAPCNVETDVLKDGSNCVAGLLELYPPLREGTRSGRFGFLVCEMVCFSLWWRIKEDWKNIRSSLYFGFFVRFSGMAGPSWMYLVAPVY